VSTRVPVREWRKSSISLTDSVPSLQFNAILAGSRDAKQSVYNFNRIRWAES